MGIFYEGLNVVPDELLRLVVDRTVQFLVRNLKGFSEPILEVLLLVQMDQDGLLSGLLKYLINGLLSDWNQLSFWGKNRVQSVEQPPVSPHQLPESRIDLKRAFFGALQIL